MILCFQCCWWYGLLVWFLVRRIIDRIRFCVLLVFGNDGVIGDLIKRERILFCNILINIVHQPLNEGWSRNVNVCECHNYFVCYWVLYIRTNSFALQWYFDVSSFYVLILYIYSQMYIYILLNCEFSCQIWMILHHQTMQEHYSSTDFP